MSLTPYYQQDGTTIYHGDCLEVLTELPKGCANLIVTDPPYGINWSGTLRRKQSSLGLIVGDDGSLNMRDALVLMLSRITHNRHFYIFGRPDLTGLPVSGIAELIWDKEIPGPAAPAPWQYQHEYITFGSHVDIPASRARNDGAGAARLRRGTVLRYRRASGLGAQQHPTEKPVDLLRELIESSSRIGEVVLDPFMGIGSTLVAARLEGRRAIGIEIEERYCEIAARRLSQGVLPFEGVA